MGSEIYIAVVVVSIIMLVMGVMIPIIIVNYKRKQESFFREKERLAQAYKQTLLQSQLETQEQTLQHLSTELHDNLGALASLIKINLLTIPVKDPEKATAKIADTADLTRQMIADIKSLSVSLNSDRIARKGFFSSLATEVERINKTGSFNVELHIADNTPAPDNDKAIILFRMMQEILNNMVKHSEAQNIHINITSNQNTISIVLKDDGVGFDMQEKMQGDGSGLHNLQKRAAMIGATLDMQSSPGNGSRVIIELPVS